MEVGAFSLTVPQRIVFGRGKAAEAVSSALAFGSRVLVVRGRSSRFAEEAIGALRTAGAEVSVIFGKGEPDLPGLQAALQNLSGRKPDCVVAIGGGSVIDLGKALAGLVPQPGVPMDYLEVVGRGLPLEERPLPFIAVPTTAGTGAEATKNAVIGVPEHARKVSLRDALMLPDLAIVDPALTDGCPKAVTLASGLDAITQVIEPYICRKANPMTDALCAAAIPRGLVALRALMDQEDTAARDDMAYVSLIGGIALANSGLGAVHGLAGPIGGRSGAAHGAVCGRLLVPSLRINLEAMRAAGADLRKIRDVQGYISTAFDVPTADALDTFQDWIDAQGLPKLSGLTGQGFDQASAVADAASSSSMKANPVDLSPDDLMRMCQMAG